MRNHRSCNPSEFGIKTICLEHYFLTAYDIDTALSRLFNATTREVEDDEVAVFVELCGIDTAHVVDVGNDVVVTVTFGSLDNEACFDEVGG